jgi:hypothetical protein
VSERAVISTEFYFWDSMPDPSLDPMSDPSDPSLDPMSDPSDPSLDPMSDPSYDSIPNFVSNPIGIQYIYIYIYIYIF